MAKSLSVWLKSMLNAGKLQRLKIRFKEMQDECLPFKNLIFTV